MIRNCCITSAPYCCTFTSRRHDKQKITINQRPTNIKKKFSDANSLKIYKLKTYTGDSQIVQNAILLIFSQYC